MVDLDLSRRLGLHTSSLMPKGKSVEPAMYLLLLLATHLLLSHYLPSFLGDLLAIKHQSVSTSSYRMMVSGVK
jgi:hypothetical protein